jgi:3,4-dihydroxy-2-butanone 4-phosphate synthase
MRDTQVAKPNPLRKKMAAVAARAWDFEIAITLARACRFERIGVLSSIKEHSRKRVAATSPIASSG